MSIVLWIVLSFYLLSVSDLSEATIDKRVKAIHSASQRKQNSVNELCRSVHSYRIYLLYADKGILLHLAYFRLTGNKTKQKAADFVETGVCCDFVDTFRLPLAISFFFLTGLQSPCLFMHRKHLCPCILLYLCPQPSRNVV